MSGESWSARRALDAVAGQLEPLADSEEAFHSRLARALAEVARARACVLLRLEADGVRVLAESGALEPRRLAPLTDPDTLQAAAHGGRPPEEGGEMLAVLWSTADVTLGVVTVFDSTAGRFADGDRDALEVAAGAAALVWRQRRLLHGLLAARAQEAERVRSAADRAIELEEMKRRILNLAAHELRGPVTVIRGYLEMLADGSLDEHGLRRVLPILNGKAAQMDALVTQMLEVARLEEGRLELKREIVDLGAICREAVDVAGLITPPGVSLFLERPPQPIPVWADRDRIATIVANLVDNAIKYSPDGGVVHCRNGVREGRAFVEIRDRGLGIADEDIPTLFSRFGRIVTPENSHIPGTGLGLHLSRDLARMHGGDISVSSQLGEGSTFTLWLPVAEEARSAAG